MKKFDEKLKKYQQLGKGMLGKKKHNIPTLNDFLKLSALPVVALALTNTAQGQCVYNIATNLNVPKDNNTGFAFDADGVAGNDFRIFELNGQAALRLEILNTDFSVVRTAGTASGASVNRIANAVSVDVSNYALFANSGAADLYLAYGSAGGKFTDSNGAGYVIFKSKTTGNVGFFKLEVVSGDPSQGGGLNITIDEAGVGSSSTFTTGDCSSLPVELLSFTVQPTSNALNVSWRTATEENNAGFELQRSTNSVIFKTITFVEGAGSTQEEQSYSFDDEDIKKNKTYYYRLKQIDYSGKSENSDVVSGVLGDAKGTTGNFYPNPTSNYTQVDYTTANDGDLNIEVYNLTGQLLHSENRSITTGTNTLAFDFSNLPTGTVFVKLSENGEDSVYKKLIIK